MKMEVVVKDDRVEDIVNKIVDELGSTNVGGKIFVVDVDTAVDLALRELGEKTL
jgi:nitrogen regulatory protein PII